ncbi:MAG: low affinity iron permease family protein [Pyrinomonadaceae bacterium]
MEEYFRKFAKVTTEWFGSAIATVAAFTVVALWIIGGLHFGYGTDYQMYINTGTTIITFLMVFVIQHTQNRDTKAFHLKLDELIKATKGASDSMIDLDELSDEQLKKLEQEYKRICAEKSSGDTEKKAAKKAKSKRQK